ncbi:MAG: DUF1772 domain-containing protein [Reyranella sp.]
MLPTRASSIVFFIALLASAAMLGPALAHAFELPAIMKLPRDEYFIVQQVYRGWSNFSLLLVVVQLISLVTTAYLERRERRVLLPTVLAILFVLGAQVLFWAYSHPANVATANWTMPTDDWVGLRRVWEYSSVARAGLQALAMTALIIAVVSRLPSRQRSYRYY